MVPGSKVVLRKQHQRHRQGRQHQLATAAQQGAEVAYPPQLQLQQARQGHQNGQSLQQARRQFRLLGPEQAGGHQLQQTDQPVLAALFGLPQFQRCQQQHAEAEAAQQAEGGHPPGRGGQQAHGQPGQPTARPLRRCRFRQPSFLRTSF